MLTKYQTTIDNEAIQKRLQASIGRIYQLLPTREEDLDWKKPLETIIEEFAGMDIILPDLHDYLFPLLCKLAGLYTFTEDEDFLNYRRTVFECISLVSEMSKNVA